MACRAPVYSEARRVALTALWAAPGVVPLERVSGCPTHARRRSRCLKPIIHRFQAHDERRSRWHSAFLGCLLVSINR